MAIDSTNFKAPANVAGVLQDSARTYRKDLIKMPVLALERYLQHMTLRPGIVVSETVGELSGDAEFAPYSEVREKSDAGIAINSRALEVFFGNVEFDFSPNAVYSTIYGNNVTNGEGLRGVPIALQVLSYIALKLGGNIAKVLWSAVRNATGNKSKDLFNGFDTITSTEIAANNISTTLGNLVEVDAITNENALAVIQGICESADEVLMDEDLKLYVPRAVHWKFNKACLDAFGAAPYNKEYNKFYVPGFENVEIVPMGNKKNSQFLHLSTRSNMLVGVNQGSDTAENIEINRFSSFVLTYAATTFFGVQFESIAPERLLVAKMAASNVITPDPTEGEDTTP